MIDFILHETSPWVLRGKGIKDCSMNDMIRNWVTCISISLHKKHALALEWVPPIGGMAQIDFDGASFGNPGLAGYGCVMHDSQGHIMLSKGVPIGIINANHVELIGLLEGLRMLESKGFKEYCGRGF